MADILLLLDWRSLLVGLGELKDRPVKRNNETDETMNLAKRVRGFNL